jgi:Bacterial protein of unknown function (DUF899)
MSVTFPNETPDYQGARTALLEREVALRREMEAVAAELRALPAGGEVPEDYSFDSIGLDGAPSTVRLSELFRGGDTLMLYHYMLPRRAQDSRPGPTAGAMAQVPLAEGPCPSCTALIDMWEGTMPPFLGPRRQPCRGRKGPDRADRGVGARQGMEAHPAAVSWEQHLQAGLSWRGCGGSASPDHDRIQAMA